MALWRRKWLMPPPSAPANSEYNPNKSVLLQKLLQKEESKRLSMLRQNVDLDNDMVQVHSGDPIAVENVFCNFDLCRIVLSYI